MIDWSAFCISTSDISSHDLSILKPRTDLIVKISPEGEERSWSGLWDSLRSDDNGIAYKLNERELIINGSPASVIHHNNVFGTNDIVQGFNDMLSFFDRVTGTNLNRQHNLWKCRRIDYTQNYDLGGQIAVDQAINYFKKLPTRGNNVDTEKNGFVYNKGSRRRKGKGYNKYKHALYAMDKGIANYTNQELELVKRLLRLELELGSKFLHEQYLDWTRYTPEYLKQQHTDFFKRLFINDIEVPTMDSLLEKLIEVSPTEGQAKSALTYLHTIKQMGSITARSMTTSSTHYRHKKNLELAGLTEADIQSGEILHFRPQIITMRPVNSWGDIELNQEIRRA